MSVLCCVIPHTSPSHAWAVVKVQTCYPCAGVAPRSCPTNGNSVIAPLMCQLFARLFVSWKRLQYTERCAIRRDKRVAGSAQAMTLQVSSSLCPSMVPSKPKNLVVCVIPTDRSSAMRTKNAADGKYILPSFLVVSCVRASLRLNVCSRGVVSDLMKKNVGWPRSLPPGTNKNTWPQSHVGVQPDLTAYRSSSLLQVACLQ